MAKIVFVVQSLVIGGMERGTLYLASRAQQAGFDSRLILFDVPYENNERQYDPHSVPVDFIRRRPGFDLVFAINLARALRSSRTDIVHAQGASAVFYSALAVSILAKKMPSLIGTFRNLPYSNARKIRLVTRWAAKRAYAITAVSNELRGYLVSTGWVDRCITIRSGVDTAQFSPARKNHWRTKLGLNESALLIGHVGRFDENKRQIDLLHAFRLVRDYIPSAALVYVGEGEQRRSVCLQSVDCERIYFLPQVTDLASLLCDLDIFVICSMHEGTPRALLEAMACGCPVVGTAVGGIPDILNGQDGMCGMTVPPMRPDLLADAILKLAAPQNRAGLHCRARKRVVEEFSAEKEWTNYLQLYEAVLSSPDRARIVLTANA